MSVCIISMQNTLRLIFNSDNMFIMKILTIDLNSIISIIDWQSVTKILLLTNIIDYSFYYQSITWYKQILIFVRIFRNYLWHEFIKHTKVIQRQQNNIEINNELFIFLKDSSAPKLNYYPSLETVIRIINHPKHLFLHRILKKQPYFLSEA